MVSKAQQGEMWSVPMPQVEQAICNMLEALPSLKAFWENEHALQEVLVQSPNICLSEPVCYHRSSKFLLQSQSLIV